MQKCEKTEKAECMRKMFLNRMDIFDQSKRNVIRLAKKIGSLKCEAVLLKYKILGDCEILKDNKMARDEMVRSINLIMKMFRDIINKAYMHRMIYRVSRHINHLIEIIKFRYQCFKIHYSDFEIFLNKTNFCIPSPVEEQHILEKLCHLSNKLKNLPERKISEEDEENFQKISYMLMMTLPSLEDFQLCSEVDGILYKDINRFEMEYIMDTKKLLSTFDLHVLTHAYHHMVVVKSIANQCFDNVFLKLVEIKGKTGHWFLDGIITELLESKIIHQICIGLKIFKTYLKVDGFAYGVEIDLCYAASDLSKISDLHSFVDRDENEMARFVAKLAKDCYNLMEEKDDILIYTSVTIFEQISQGDKIGQHHVRALYEIIKSGRSSRKIFGDLNQFKLERLIRNVVYSFLYYIRCFNKRYEELDEEMREIDKQNGQEFGGFSLEVVADDDMNPPCASDGLEKSTFNKYFFYDDAMKTLSMLSFLYNCVEEYTKEKLQHFKLGVILSHVTEFVVTLIHQHELNQKIDKPIWIMEKILNTCPFVVFGHDEEEEKDIFMKLMNEGEINKVELFRLKDFMKKNGLSYNDECQD